MMEPAMMKKGIASRGKDWALVMNFWKMRSTGEPVLITATDKKPEENSEPVVSEIKPVETGAKPTDDDNVVWTEIQPASEVTEKAAEESKETEQKEEDPFTELEQKMEQNMADPGLPGAAPQPSSPLFEMKEVK